MRYLPPLTEIGQQIKNNVAQEKHADVPRGVVHHWVCKNPSVLYAQGIDDHAPNRYGNAEPISSAHLLIDAKQHLICNPADEYQRQQSQRTRQKELLEGKSVGNLPDISIHKVAG